MSDLLLKTSTIYEKKLFKFLPPQQIQYKFLCIFRIVWPPKSLGTAERQGSFRLDIRIGVKYMKHIEKENQG